MSGTSVMKIRLNQLQRAHAAMVVSHHPSVATLEQFTTINRIKLGNPLRSMVLIVCLIKNF
jgi:hypothetical protein